MLYNVEFNLKKIRLSNNLTQEKLSKISGVSRSYISELENYEKSPTLSVIQKLANALKIHPHVLIEVDVDEIDYYL